ncbi:efflux RND transporter periplasmic adaptor subunit [Iningainema tapete]|uniref:Efflux RND transporter periplasmic adaptor subunit n=1 Tax=Iningainema tapete BLCC-T55 TaxID=2748662 RepID=A0A8J6XI71_9CYAN|nr:efflux RND transporter periplasmic adaptor subunit [Iningainema tapete]MBD2773202.1 efflux RND transporter periplasmic adaptor subunit [Iningainema tapete BLCC-T55]
MSKAGFLFTQNKVIYAALIASILTSACGQGKPTAKASVPKPIPVKLQLLESSKVSEVSEFVGRLEAQQRVSLQPQIQGRIEAIPVSSGDRVKQGTPIVRLRPDSTQPELNSAIARVNSAKSAYGTAQAEVRVAESQRIRDAANVELQTVQFRRAQQLVSQGAQAKQELDIAQNNLKTATATLRASQDRVDSARASLNQALANIRQAEADAATARVSFQYKQVLAPITGEVGDFPVKVGDYVNTGQTLTTVTQNDNLFLRISIPTNRTAQLRRGLPVELVDPNTKKRLSTGSINFISPEVDTGSQAVLVKARFPNQNGSLREGQFVRARVIWSERPGVLLPTVAVSNVGAQSFVYVAQSSGAKQTVRQQPVKLGAIQGQTYQVLEGVQVGDRIAVTQILNLRNGTPIQPES